MLNNVIINENENIAMKSKYHAQSDTIHCRTFAETVLYYCEQKGITNGNDFILCTFLNRNVYYNLKKDRNYIPTENMAYSICFGLRLTFAEATHLLSLARYSLLPTTPQDLYREMLVEMLITGMYYIPDCNKQLEIMNFRKLGSATYDNNYNS